MADAGEPARAESTVADRILDVICRGNFAEAAKIISQAREKSDVPAELLSKFEHLVGQCEHIEQRRLKDRQDVYQKQLARLDKFKNIVAGKVVAKDPNDANDVNDLDLSDANDLRLVLSAVAKASEFADQLQKLKLLTDEFVKQVFQKAADRAARFEAEGKWVEAYTNCYGWLAAIDPNNKGYSDYADQLLEKADIAASFEDSPCETSKERYDGVKKEMFKLAVHALSIDYVSVPDYRRMAVAAVERCKLLAEVLQVSVKSRENVASAKDPNAGPTDPNTQTGSEESAAQKSEDSSFSPPDKQRLSAWLAAIAAVKDEIEQAPAGFAKKEFLDVFEKVLQLNKATAELPEPILVAQFTEGAFSSLDDYTVMVWPRQVEDFEKMMMNEFTGIGVEISKRAGVLTVASLLPDTPAYKVGLDAGDVIEAVDGVETKDMTLMCAVRKITGPKGTKVTLRIKRAAEPQAREITITRDKIVVPTLRGWQRTPAGKWLYLIDEQDKVGYVRITSFSGETAADLEAVLDELEKTTLAGLILDVRANPGGLLSSAVGVADKFLKEGLIVKTQPRPGFRRWPSYETAHEKKTHPEYPLVILIDGGSASGSEILAGALADKTHKRAILVGTRTHGKGSVQTATPYPGGGAQLKYTMAYYHLPSGQRVESKEEAEKHGSKEWGVAPNLTVELTSEEIKKLIDIERDNEVLAQAEGGHTDRELNKHTLEQTLEADPQLAVGLLVVKAQLARTQTAQTLAGLASKNSTVTK